MKATYVAPTVAPLSLEDAAECMNYALAMVLNATPPTEVLALSLAKTALETARWKAIWNNNWGNVKAGEQYVGQFTCITLNEVIGNSVVWFSAQGQLNRKGGEVIGKVWDVPPGHPQTRMRSYPDARTGAVEYVQFVASGRYRDAWSELLEGDAVGYVHALKMKGYFTADEATYARGVLSLQKEFIAKLNARPAPEMPVLEPEDVRGLIARQPFNVAEVQAIATAAAADSRLALQDEARREAIRDTARMDGELLEPKDDETTVNDRPRRA